jgi:hypothetical protein
MSACPPGGNSDCRVFQVIEPDSTSLVATSGGSTDASLDERGSVALASGQEIVEVAFRTIKASENYRFEYLYVDNVEVGPQVNPLIVPEPPSFAPIVDLIPITQTIFGFTIRLLPNPTPAPTTLEPVPDIPPFPTGYFLRWRVVVIDLSIGLNLDVPETIYIQLPRVNQLVVHLTNQRSSIDYTFDELRVENVIDPVTEQTPVLVQVVAKTQTSFTIGLSPTPPTDNYFLAVHIP